MLIPNARRTAGSFAAHVRCRASNASAESSAEPRSVERCRIPTEIGQASLEVGNHIASCNEQRTPLSIAAMVTVSCGKPCACMTRSK